MYKTKTTYYRNYRTKYCGSDCGSMVKCLMVLVYSYYTTATTAIIYKQYNTLITKYILRIEVL